MPLSAYRQKRNFKKTQEPTGAKQKKSSSLLFVVQEHSARNLHYDFRLEMKGVLKSWAVPKGPSMNPEDKRLAMMVEDHPYDYKDFEGIIPEGNYGAGNVIVWDNGTYHALGITDKKESEKKLLSGIHKGHISFILKGKKLNGEFALVKMKGRGENAWLLIKKNDEYATDNDILKKDQSVRSGKKLEPRLRSDKKKSKRASKNELTTNGKESSNTKTALPEPVKPMKAQLVDEPFNDSNWIFEIKYDGYRAIAAIDGKGKVELFSRNMLSFNNQYKVIADELKKIDHAALIDGEVVVEDEKRRSHFQLLQKYRREGKGILKYYAFDLLSLDGIALENVPLVERKKLLLTLLKKYEFNNIFFSEHITEKGIAFFKEAKKKEFEGVIAKRASSIYRPDKRSGDWLKIKVSLQQEAIVLGITKPGGSRKYFGSLLLGAYEDGELKYIGNCGTGFDQGALKELFEKFKPFFTNASAFEKKIKLKGEIQWIKPHFVCEVKFTEWTADGSMRHPVYLGLRKDKMPNEVIKEIPEKMKKNKSKKEKTKKVNGEIEIGKVTLKLTNQEKIYFPEDNISKGELVTYYTEISSLILPYLKGRPESLNRFPNGIHGQSFFQKDMDKKKIPGWIKTERIYSESNKKYINYLICNDKATLIYLANLGCIEINPWNSRITNPENPDWMVIDLDPEKISFKEVVKAANTVHDVLEEMNIECYCKTSGATGLHVYVPLAAMYNYDIVKNFAQLIAQITHERLSATTSILRLPSKRQGKVYLDFLQNRRGQTLAAPYSVRPKLGATVSAPLEWKEVNERLDPSQFTIRNILKRLEKKDDLWRPVLKKGANLDKAIKSVYEEA